MPRGVASASPPFHAPNLLLLPCPACPVVTQDEVATLAARREELLVQLVAAPGLDDPDAGWLKTTCLGSLLACHAALPCRLPAAGSSAASCMITRFVYVSPQTCCVCTADLHTCHAEAEAVAALQQQMAWRDEARGTGGGSLPQLLLDDPRLVLPSARKAAAALEGLLLALQQQVGWAESEQVAVLSGGCILPKAAGESK